MAAYTAGFIINITCTLTARGRASTLGVRLTCGSSFTFYFTFNSQCAWLYACLCL